MELFYGICFALSFLLSVFYVGRYRKHFDVNITVIFILIPLASLGYPALSMATNLEEALLAQKIIYLGGCFLPFFTAFAVFGLCKIKVHSLVKVILFLLNSAFYMMVLDIGHAKLFYKEVSFVEEGGRTYLEKVYGFGHTLFYALILVYLVIDLATIIYAVFRKKQASRTTVYLLLFPILFTVAGFFGGKAFGGDVELTPVFYVLAQMIYLFIVERMSYYRTADMVIESMIQGGEDGFITLDLKHRYLGSNETAREIIPEIAELYVDEKIDDKAGLNRTLIHWLALFEESDKNNKNLFIKKDPVDDEKDKMYSIRIDYSYHGSKKNGYQIVMEDDTADQKYIRLLDRYNTELEDEVDRKTKRVVEMHNNLILSMATMVESRDNSTGGHIKRTSEGVRILIDEMRKNGNFALKSEFCKNIIKAAPMHDLGKIVVDDAILRKPGKFTPEEYEVMKKHSAEGARIVHEILKDTDDEAFKVVAENVAHYHHERWDGSGYPEGLKGEEIPLEARIMAIADVYDALVSKRVYKEKMSFEKADSIIMEGMGKHFDESLKEAYVAARPKLEEYYRNMEE